jgi:L-lactate dehydrogenase complex protein LldG
MRQGGMVPEPSETIKQFQLSAEKVSAKVYNFSTVEAALSSAIDICSRKEACTLLLSGCEADLSAPAEALCESKNSNHVIAAPDLSPDHARWLKECALKTRMTIVTNGLRKHLGGIDMGITWAEYGIAQTGSLVINSTDEDRRLATMISEIHVVLLETAHIYPTADALTGPLKEWMSQKDNYTAFITGASRTADIERVLALGVHGPLELVIMLIKGDK